RPSTVVGTDTGASGPDPRVEEHVGEVAEDLRRHRHAHGHQRADLDEGDVLEEGRLEHHAAEAGIREHGLDHDHARDQVVDLEQDHGNGIDHGVSRGMADDHAAEAHALEHGGPDVGALHHLDHRGADHAHDVAGIEQHDHGHGQHELRGDRPATPRHQRGGARQPTEPDHQKAGAAN